MTPCLSEPHFLHWQSFAWVYMCVCRLMDALLMHIYMVARGVLGSCYSDSVFLDVFGSIVGLDLTS